MGSFIALLLLFFACAPAKEYETFNDANNIHVKAHEMLIAADAAIIIDVGLAQKTLKELEGQIFLLKNPKDEEIDSSQWKKSELFALGNLEKGSTATLKPKKKLNEGHEYGVYLRSKNSDKAKLTHIFRTKRKAVRLIKHNIGSAFNHDIPENRLHYSFDFEGPVKVPHDNAIKVLSSNDGREVAIQSITVTFNKQQIKVTLVKDQLKVSEKYFFTFPELLNEDGQKAELEPIAFTVCRPDEPIEEFKVPQVSAGFNNAEINWFLSKEHHAEIFYGEDKGFHAGLVEACPRLSHLSTNNSKDETKGFMSSFFIEKLLPNTRYHFLLRAEDLAGNIVINAGVFRTDLGPQLRFSEIFFASKNVVGISRQKTEFIELFHSGDRAQTFYDVKIIFENTNGNFKREYVIANKKNPLRLEAKSYVLIVGKEFDLTQFNIPHDVTIMRLANKSLYGGLENHKTAIIKLQAEKGTLFDYYRGSLFAPSAGRSIVCQEALKTYNANNYCSADFRPSPGFKNDKLSSSG